MKPRTILRALRALWRAHRRRGRPRPHSPTKIKQRERMRRRALQRLGGACSCCGLNMDFAPVLTFHHVNRNGEEHRRVLSGLGLSLAQWILVADNPAGGLFAVEVLCVACHRMEHEAGKCPHRWKGSVRAAG